MNVICKLAALLMVGLFSQSAIYAEDVRTERSWPLAIAQSRELSPKMRWSPFRREVQEMNDYRAEVESKICQIVSLTERTDLFVELSISKDGCVKSARLVNVEAEPVIDQNIATQIVSNVRDLRFGPLPDWYEGADFLFVIDLGKVKTKSQ